MMKLKKMSRKLKRYILKMGIVVSVFVLVLSVCYYVGIRDIPWGITGSIFILLILFDHITTHYALSIGGVELNFIVDKMFKYIGRETTSVAMFCGSVLLILFLWRYLSTPIQIGAVSAYSIVPINNLLVIRRLIGHRGEN